MSFPALLPVALPIAEPSQTGEARRVAAALARRVGCDETDSGRVSLVVTELGRNLALHARQGKLIVRPLAPRGIEVLSLDKGPGMKDVAACLRDGFSTARTPGTGLGAVRRLSDVFDIYTRPEMGTSIMARVYARTPRAPVAPLFETGVVCLPKPGEEICGDAWSIVEQQERARLMVADGLGHGPLASEASREAVRIFNQNGNHTPEVVLQLADAALRKTRGAAVAVAEIHPPERSLDYVSVGNISAAIWSADGTSRSMVSFDGTVGHAVRKIQRFSYAWPESALLIMHSDGIATLHLKRYPGLLVRHPALIAGVLYRDFSRPRDDATVIAVRGYVRP